MRRFIRTSADGSTDGMPGAHLERHAPTVIGENDNLSALAARPPDHLLADPMELEAFRGQPVL
jgi:hypothetical protein